LALKNKWKDSEQARTNSWWTHQCNEFDEEIVMQHVSTFPSSCQCHVLFFPLDFVFESSMFPRAPHYIIHFRTISFTVCQCMIKEKYKRYFLKYFLFWNILK
jgi:hypothetical protein